MTRTILEVHPVSGIRTFKTTTKIFIGYYELLNTSVTLFLHIFWRKFAFYSNYTSYVIYRELFQLYTNKYTVIRIISVIANFIKSYRDPVYCKLDFSKALWNGLYLRYHQPLLSFYQSGVTHWFDVQWSFTFVYRTADISTLTCSSLDSSCSVHKCEWHRMYTKITKHKAN